MLAKLTMRSIRALTWFCVVLLAVLSLLPAQDMVRTGFPGRVEHIAAYAGSAAIAMAGYGASRGPRRCGLFVRWAARPHMAPDCTRR